MQANLTTSDGAEPAAAGFWNQTADTARAFWGQLVFADRPRDLQLNTTQKLIAATVALMVSLAVFYVFWEILKVLLRMKALRTQLAKLDNDELLRVVGSRGNAASIRSNADDVWTNVAIFGFALIFGTGTLLGILSGLANLGRVALNSDAE